MSAAVLWLALASFSARDAVPHAVQDAGRAPSQAASQVADPGASQDAAGWAALERGELARAHAQALGLDDALSRARLATEALYLGRRFDSAHAAALEGLARDPADARLALRAVQSSLWSRRPRQAERDLAALSDAVAASVAPEHRAGWQASIDAHAADAARLLEAERRLASAHRRSSRVVAGGLAAVALAFLALAFLPQRAARAARLPRP